MNRRGFLSLLVASAAVPAFAKLPGLLPEPGRALELAGAPLDRDELAELVGAPLERPRPRFTRESLRAAALDGPRVTRAVLPFGPDEGFDAQIGPGRIGRLIAMPQRPFRADRLLALEGFDLLGLSVHGEPLLEESVPSDLFLPGSPYCGAIGFHMTRPGDVIVMVVRNKGPTRRFAPTLIGNCVEL